MSDLTLKEARDLYFKKTGFSIEGYSAAWIKVDTKPIPFYFPNSSSRKRAIPLHDLHHVLTGYPTTVLGEAEIGAWELATGCKDYYAAWALNLAAVCLGGWLGPKQVLRAFLRGRKSKNLYGREVNEALLGQTVGAMKLELGLK